MNALIPDGIGVHVPEGVGQSGPQLNPRRSDWPKAKTGNDEISPGPTPHLIGVVAASAACTSGFAIAASTSLTSTRAGSLQAGIAGSQVGRVTTPPSDRNGVSPM